MIGQSRELMLKTVPRQVPGSFVIHDPCVMTRALGIVELIGKGPILFP